MASYLGDEPGQQESQKAMVCFTHSVHYRENKMISKCTERKAPDIYVLNDVSSSATTEGYGPAVIVARIAHYAPHNVVGAKRQEDALDIWQAANEEKVPYFRLFQ